MRTIYDAAGGNDAILRLAHAWHKRVLEDDVVSHAFSHGFHPEHTERLAAYWAEALGGPTTYSERYGDETSVVQIHSGNGQRGADSLQGSVRAGVGDDRRAVRICDRPNQERVRCT